MQFKTFIYLLKHLRTACSFKTRPREIERCNLFMKATRSHFSCPASQYLWKGKNTFWFWLLWSLKKIYIVIIGEHLHPPLRDYVTYRFLLVNYNSNEDFNVPITFSGFGQISQVLIPGLQRSPVQDIAEGILKAMHISYFWRGREIFQSVDAVKRFLIYCSSLTTRNSPSRLAKFYSTDSKS